MRTLIFPRCGFAYAQFGFVSGGRRDRMIAKHIRMKDSSKSRILRLVDYIADTQGKTQRVRDSFISNCIADDLRMAAREMYATQQKNTSSKGDKTYHLLISFRPGEEPGRDMVRRIEKEVCGKLGFGEHQRVAVVHKDTDNVHMHIVINMIHPRKLTMCTPFRDHFTLGRVCGELEKKYRLDHDNHDPSGKTQAERKAGDIEAMTGQESLVSWIRRECLPAMRAAESWEELHAELAKAGLSLALRGNGLAVSDRSGARVTGSKIDRAFSKEHLEKRLGAFRPAPAEVKSITPIKTYGRAPIVTGRDTALVDEYRRSREAAEKERSARLTAITADERQKVIT